MLFNYIYIYIQIQSLSIKDKYIKEIIKDKTKRTIEEKIRGFGFEIMRRKL